MSKTDEMQIFVEVVRLGTLVDAARKLNLSAPTVTKQISALEDRLGTRLLNRTTRKVTPTEAGELFYQSCNKIIEQIDAAESEVRQLREELRGTLRVTSSTDFSRLHLSKAITEFAHASPYLRLELHFSDENVDLRSEAFDVAIRIGELVDSTMVARRLGGCRRVICASHEYLSAHGTPTLPEHLADHECIGYEHLQGAHGWKFVVDGRTKIYRPQGRYNTNCGWMIRDLALAGLGIGFMPTFLVEEDLAVGRLVTVLDEYLDDDVNIYAVFPSRANLPMKVRSFVDFLMEYFERHLNACPWRNADHTATGVWKSPEQSDLHA